MGEEKKIGVTRKKGKRRKSFFHYQKKRIKINFHERKNLFFIKSYTLLYFRDNRKYEIMFDINKKKRIQQ